MTNNTCLTCNGSGTIYIEKSDINCPVCKGTGYWTEEEQDA